MSGVSFARKLFVSFVLAANLAVMALWAVGFFLRHDAVLSFPLDAVSAIVARFSCCGKSHLYYNIVLFSALNLKVSPSGCRVMRRTLSHENGAFPPWREMRRFKMRPYRIL